MQLIKSLVLAGFIFGVISCEYDSTSKNVTSSCITGTYITWHCPGELVVDAVGTGLGQSWTFNGKTYQNAISLGTSPPNGANPGDNVYFQIDSSKSACLFVSPCPLNVNPSPGGTLYCVKSISSFACSDAD